MAWVKKASMLSLLLLDIHSNEQRGVKQILEFQANNITQTQNDVAQIHNGLSHNGNVALILFFLAFVLVFAFTTIQNFHIQSIYSRLETIESIIFKNITLYKKT